MAQLPDLHDLVDSYMQVHVWCTPFHGKLFFVQPLTAHVALYHPCKYVICDLT